MPPAKVLLVRACMAVFWAGMVTGGFLSSAMVGWFCMAAASAVVALVVMLGE